MALPKVPARLPELVKTAFATALSEGSLFYFPTHVQDMSVGALSLRFSPSLANKPKAVATATAAADKTSKPFDPFEYTTTPRPKLFVGDVGASHFLVLNKFAVVPAHFILATRRFEAQTHVLDADDLHATLACIRSWEEEEGGGREGENGDARLRGSDGGGGGRGDGLFAFFNCGEHSGASQPHRHIQLLPVAGMRDGLPRETSSWTVLASRLDGATTAGVVAPFTTFSEEISLDVSKDGLYQAYIRLYEQAVRAVKGEESAVARSGEAAISYNMAMTRDRLVLCPRLAEGADVKDPDTGDTVGRLSLNGTMLAGTALVKTEAEWDALRKNPQGLTAVLKSVGVPQPKFIEQGNKLQKKCQERSQAR